jgi:hypothetical protein
MKNPIHTNGEIVEYLLGRLPPERADEIEEQIMMDDDFHQEVEIAEEDLLDRYVHNELTAEDHHCVETIFSRSPVRRQALQSAVALRRKIDSTEPVPLRSPRFSPYPYAVAASILLAAYLGVANFQTAKQLKQSESYVSFLAKELENARQRNSSTSQGLSSQDPIMVAKLSPRKRTGGSRIQLPNGIRAVQFVLKVPSGFHGEGSVKLLADPDQLITTVPSVFPQDVGDQHVVVATFPVEVFRTGNYRLLLVGKELNSFTSEYSFGIQ